MKTLIAFVLIGFLCTGLFVENSYSQNSKGKTKTSGTHVRGSKKLDRKKESELIKSHVKSLKKDSRGTWKLFEDFESGTFPPTGWTKTFGSAEWNQEFVSAFGVGDYCAFYSSWDCWYSNNELYSPSFALTVSGDKLIFDYAYAPWTDGMTVYYDDLEIFYFDDVDQDYYTLKYFTGDSLQTAPATNNYYYPADNEWATKIIDIPINATQIYFKVWENCSNNLFVDNIRVGPVTNGYDASVEKVWGKGKLPLVYGVPDTSIALIKNTGTTIISNLKVYLNISGTNNLIDSVVIPSLNPGDTAEVRFRGFSPVLNGFSTITVTLPDDEDNGNNERTFLTQANPNTYKHVDSNCCNGSVGWIGENAFLSKYRMNGTGQIRSVNIEISNDQKNIDQIIYGVILNETGVLVGKTAHYKLTSNDLEKLLTLQITDPKPYVLTDSYYYVGVAQTEFAGDGFAYTVQSFNYDAPAAPNANYGCGLAPVGAGVGIFEFPREYGQNYAIEATAGNQAAIDAGVSDLGLTFDQYFTSTNYTPVGKVFNAGTGSATFTVIRRITPGGYTSTKSVTGLPAGANAFVTFDPWTFISGTAYTIRDSVVLAGDGNTTNNVLSRPITPRVAKQLCVLWQQQEDKDSLVRSILADGRYANNFDTVRMNYTGSYRPWKIVFANFKNEGSYSMWTRDSLKSFLDGSTAGNKKTLVVFGNNIATINDPGIGFPNPSDSIFYRQYLKSRTINTDWPSSIPASENKFRGTGFFDGITQDSVSDPYAPELIVPVNGGAPAFKPKSVAGNGNDSCNAVSYAGASYNSFFMTNKFSSLRASSGSLRGPVLVYTKIIDWIQSVNTNVKVLDLTCLIEGFYEPVSNVMIGDTVRVYLRNMTNPYAIVDSAKGYLNASGIGSFIFNNAVNGTNYYLHIKHRSAIETWSKTPQSFSSNHLNYNFTTGANKAFGDNLKASGSKWVVYGGDPNQDGGVDLSDIVMEFNDATNFVSGYVTTDLNGDEFVDLTDVVISYNNSSLFVTEITPLSAPGILRKKGIVLDNIPQIQPEQNTDTMNEGVIDNEIYDKYRNTVNSGRTTFGFVSSRNGSRMKVDKFIRKDMH